MVQCKWSLDQEEPTNVVCPIPFHASRNRAVWDTPHPACERDTAGKIICQPQLLSGVLELYQDWKVRTRQLPPKFDSNIPYFTQRFVLSFPETDQGYKGMYSHLLSEKTAGHKHHAKGCTRSINHSCLVKSIFLQLCHTVIYPMFDFLRIIYLIILLLVFALFLDSSIFELLSSNTC